MLIHFIVFLLKQIDTLRKKLNFYLIKFFYNQSATRKLLEMILRSKKNANKI